MRALTTTDVARRPLPGTTVPTAVQFSPGGEVVTYLVAAPGSLDQSLVAVDVATGAVRVLPTPGTAVDEADLGIEEQLRRERARELAVGVTRYQWAEDADRVLVPMGDGLWLLDGLAAGGDGSARLAVPTASVDGPILDARLSVDGTRIGFVAGDEVHVADADTGAVVRVTSGAAGTGRTNGVAEYVAQEEMDRAEGFWLSPDASRVAFCEVDETHIPQYRIVHQGSDRVGEGAQEDHRYPFAGEPNARVRVGVVPADGSGAASRPGSTSTRRASARTATWLGSGGSTTQRSPSSCSRATSGDSTSSGTSSTAPRAAWSPGPSCGPRRQTSGSTSTTSCGRCPTGRCSGPASGPASATSRCASPTVPCARCSPRGRGW